jgi:hypothetical protein
MNMETYYHGSHALFDRFDLDHALEGDGKVKFGYGVYVTSKYTSAAHYSGANPNSTDHYVYTVEIPERTATNCIAFKEPVHPTILAAAEARLGEALPKKYLQDAGKEFRKFLAMKLTGQKKVTLEGEKAATAFLLSIGVELIEWPYNWKNPALGTNRAVLDDSMVRIIRVDSIKLDDKKKLIEDSITQIR